VGHDGYVNQQRNPTGFRVCSANPEIEWLT